MSHHLKTLKGVVTWLKDRQHLERGCFGRTRPSLILIKWRKRLWHWDGCDRQGTSPSWIRRPANINKIRACQREIDFLEDGGDYLHNRRHLNSQVLYGCTFLADGVSAAVCTYIT